jgi:hypothetical protein
LLKFIPLTLSFACIDWMQEKSCAMGQIRAAP